MAKEDLSIYFYFHAQKYKKPLNENEYYTSVTTI
jgi:hypothetical protein